MQNVIVLAHIDKHALIPKVKTEHYLQAMDDLMQASMLEANIKLFEEELYESCKRRPDKAGLAKGV